MVQSFIRADVYQFVLQRRQGATGQTWRAKHAGHEKHAVDTRGSLLSFAPATLCRDTLGLVLLYVFGDQ